ncbi:hypothetical protein E2C01_022173 [Portunus trituberculatus]|uniref:Uncharacterized protein n=1 Tax=Portunus trituberculatus TaxID=210409 RepID=A0A5B7E6J1_PORTR|nr:hypothetical protein [Portunus trituberculatus]
MSLAQKESLALKLLYSLDSHSEVAGVGHGEIHTVHSQLASFLESLHVLTTHSATLSISPSPTTSLSLPTSLSGDEGGPSSTAAHNHSTWTMRGRLLCAIVQLVGDGCESLQNGIVPPATVPHCILGVTGEQLVPVSHGLPRKVKIARHLSPCGIHPLLQRHYQLRRRLW